MAIDMSFDKAAKQRILYVYHNSEALKETEYVLAIRDGFRLRYEEAECKIYLTVIAFDGTKYDFQVRLNPAVLEPRDGYMTVPEKIALRFQAAAQRGTDVDLRFCSIHESRGKPERDNLRPDYGLKP